MLPSCFCSSWAARILKVNTGMRNTAMRSRISSFCPIERNTGLRESAPPASAFLEKSLADAETTLQHNHCDDHGCRRRCHSQQDRPTCGAHRPVYEDGKRDPDEDDENEGHHQVKW